MQKTAEMVNERELLISYFVTMKAKYNKIKAV